MSLNGYCRTTAPKHFQSVPRFQAFVTTRARGYTAVLFYLHSEATYDYQRRTSTPPAAAPHTADENYAVSLCGSSKLIHAARTRLHLLSGTRYTDSEATALRPQPEYLPPGNPDSYSSVAPAALSSNLSFVADKSL